MLLHTKEGVIDPKYNILKFEDTMRYLNIKAASFKNFKSELVKNNILIIDKSAKSGFAINVCFTKKIYNYPAGLQEGCVLLYKKAFDIAYSSHDSNWHKAMYRLFRIQTLVDKETNTTSTKICKAYLESKKINTSNLSKVFSKLTNTKVDDVSLLIYNAKECVVNPSFMQYMESINNTDKILDMMKGNLIGDCDV